jgi:hypothetical protein
MKLQDPICKTLLDVKLIFSLHCMSLFFLIGSCTLIKYAQGMDVYIYDFVEIIKMYRSKLYELYVDFK